MGVALQVRFYQSAAGKLPALAVIRACTREERVIIGADLRTAQNDWSPGMPLVRSNFGGGLHEVRIDLPTRSIRLMVTPRQGVLVVLHAFFKTTQKTPPAEIKIARDRMKLL